MTRDQPSRVDTPLNGQPLPIDPDRITLERAKGAVMLRYGVNSHVAFAMLARWSRTAEIPILTLAATLVTGAVEDTDFLDDQPPPDAWPGGRVIDGA